ncbi:MAG TPA: endolytic transglycosylase MltG [Thiolapillus brandeum]|uniref:Endolytic murein transglycosylase n=1 Tax=Thiolapillus brandeum TaxID=1076588 RepID=A0A831WEN6_9GAMM|nr:endolytic transglycosylase MltG [Thiolapillus brandeum]
MLKLTFKLFLKSTLLVLLLAALAGVVVWNTYREFLVTPLTIPDQGMVLNVPQGMSLRGLASHLESRHVLEDARLLRLYGRLHHEATQIKAGEYQLSRGITPVALLDLLVAGKTISHSITLVEGWTFDQMMQAIDAHPELRHDLKGLSSGKIMESLGHAGENPEGRFFPDTYLFPRDFSDRQLLKRAYGRMEDTLKQAWAEREKDLPLKNPYEMLILASIVEKETGRAGERDRIAGVFVRRLKKGMKLQTDPTVIYGMGASYKGNIRRKDLRKPTPYNTYVIAGLPPTPICMPGSGSIFAVAHPADGKALYFVAKGDGSHQFSATLRQHNAAVRKYQLKK